MSSFERVRVKNGALLPSPGGAGPARIASTGRREAPPDDKLPRCETGWGDLSTRAPFAGRDCHPTPPLFSFASTLPLQGMVRKGAVQPPSLALISRMRSTYPPLEGEGRLRWAMQSIVPRKRGGVIYPRVRCT
jgi:hypothetical protein